MLDLTSMARRALVARGEFEAAVRAALGHRVSVVYHVADRAYVASCDHHTARHGEPLIAIRAAIRAAELADWAPGELVEGYGR